MKGFVPRDVQSNHKQQEIISRRFLASVIVFIKNGYDLGPENCEFIRISANKVIVLLMQAVYQDRILRIETTSYVSQLRHPRNRRT